MNPRITRALTIIGITALCATPMLASADGLDQLKAFLENTKSGRGAFVQSVSNKAGRKPQKSAGTFAMQRPGKFRWSYDKPYKTLLVSDGEQLWSHDPDLNQVVVKKLGAAFGSSPAALLSGGDLERHFNLKNVGSVDGIDMIDAAPKSADGSFETMRIGFRNNLPHIMEIRDGFGQTTTLLFLEFQSNPKLGADLFRFSPPAGADVVKE